MGWKGDRDRGWTGAEDREVESQRARSIKDFNQTPVARERRRLATRKVLA